MLGLANGFGLGLRRTALHAKLAQRAADAGVALLWGARVTLEREGQVLCDAQPMRCKYVIGADGQASPVRTWAALDRTRYERIRFRRSAAFPYDFRGAISSKSTGRAVAKSLLPRSPIMSSASRSLHATLA